MYTPSTPLNQMIDESNINYSIVKSSSGQNGYSRPQLHKLLSLTNITYKQDKSKSVLALALLKSKYGKSFILPKNFQISRNESFIQSNINKMNSYFTSQSNGATPVNNPVMILKIAPPASGKGSKRVRDIIQQYIDINNVVEFNVDDIVEKSNTFKHTTQMSVPQYIKNQRNDQQQQKLFNDFYQNNSVRKKLSSLYQEIRKQNFQIDNNLITNLIKVSVEKKNIIVESTGRTINSILKFLILTQSFSNTNISKLNVYKRHPNLQNYKIVIIFPMTQLSTRLKRYTSRAFTSFKQNNGFRIGPSAFDLEKQTIETLSTFKTVGFELLKSQFINEIVLVNNNPLPNVSSPSSFFFSNKSIRTNGNQNNKNFNITTNYNSKSQFLSFIDLHTMNTPRFNQNNANFDLALLQQYQQKSQVK